VVGSPNAFDHTNQGIDPRPPDEFFESLSESASRDDSSTR